MDFSDSRKHIIFFQIQNHGHHPWQKETVDPWHSVDYGKGSISWCDHKGKGERWWKTTNKRADEFLPIRAHLRSCFWDPVTCWEARGNQITSKPQGQCWNYFLQPTHLHGDICWFQEKHCFLICTGAGGQGSQFLRAKWPSFVSPSSVRWPCAGALRWPPPFQHQEGHHNCLYLWTHRLHTLGLRAGHGINQSLESGVDFSWS